MAWVCKPGWPDECVWQVRGFSGAGLPLTRDGQLSALDREKSEQISALVILLFCKRAERGSGR
jgi:hypothetical protein